MHRNALLLFNSLPFIYFFLPLLLLYLCLEHRWQNNLLLLGSYYFYGLWDWRYLALLGATTVIDFACGLAVARAKAPRWRLAWLYFSIVTNLGVLGYFKYWDFFAASFAELLAKFGVAPAPQLLKTFLPAGISFYTFQSLSYVVDVYRGRIKAARNLRDYALFVAFFPHLVAGPIMRAETLLVQVAKPRQVTGARVQEGLWLLLFGYFKKTVVADNLAPFVDAMRQPGTLSGGQLLVGIYAMVVFLYADFAGYSDIARGLGKLLGFDLANNFRMPLFARNPADFWRRWHISLSNWFRDYVYVPLVQLRGKAARRGPWTLAMAVVTLMLCGLWHGPGWNFVVFGLYHGCLLAGYYLLRPQIKSLFAATGLGPGLTRVIANIGFFHCVSIAGIFFFLQKPHDWFLLYQGLIHGAYNSTALPGVTTLVAFFVPLVLIEALQEARNDMSAVVRLAVGARLTVFATIFFYILLAGATSTHAFVYFQF